MITVQQFTNWHIRPISVYRFLEKQFVDDFFDFGKIRLSSFAQFRQHKDEIRGDGSEGSGHYLANFKPLSGSGHHFYQLMNTGLNAYVLSTTLINRIETFKDCQYDSGFRINDAFSFALEICRALPYYLEGMQGQCIYFDKPIIPIDLGQFNISDINNQEKEQKQLEFSTKVKQDTDVFFVKLKPYEPQHEYRLLWFVDADTVDYIDLICPNARNFCERL